MWSGTSAGGVSAYLHPSYVRSRLLGPGARLVAMPDAGFFPDHGTMAPPHEHAWIAQLRSAVSLWNATLRGDAAACAAANADDIAKCLFPQYLYPYSSVPHFMLNSVMDTAGLGICFSAECNPFTTCNASQTADILAYAAELQATITASAALFGERDGYFLTSCYQHEESCRTEDWYGIVINGQNANATFAAWYAAGSAAAPAARRVDVTWPNDASCAPQTDTRHGAC